MYHQSVSYPYWWESWKAKSVIRRSESMDWKTWRYHHEANLYNNYDSQTTTASLYTLGNIS